MTDVYANGMNIACKAAAGKTIAAMPDVCLSPPTPPAGPVPIPYPNTAMASDTTDGSKTVQIGGDEVMLKNKSSFKQSNGDEAATKSLGMGVVTHQIQGKANFCAWSMDVKFEGENVPRHLDLMGHNEMSDPPNTPPWLYTDTMDVSKVPEECKEQANTFNDKCKKHVKTHSDGSMNMQGTNNAMCDDNECKKARECILVPYDMGCCDKITPHHVVPKSQFKERGATGAALKLASGGKYDPGKAPCICVGGTTSTSGMHGDIHEETNNLTVHHPSVAANVSETGRSIDPGARWTVGESESVGAEATEQGTGGTCKKKCTQAQARQGHENMNIESTDKIRPTTAGRVTNPNPSNAPDYE